MTEATTKKEYIFKKLEVTFSGIDGQIVECDREETAQTVIKNSCQAEGDLRENEGYHAAMNKIAQLNIKKALLLNKKEAWLDFKENKQLSNSTEYVSIGSLVVLELEEKSQQFTVLIVPPLLGDAANNAITTESKVGAGVLGKMVGEKVAITTPRAGDLSYKILNIS